MKGLLSPMLGVRCHPAVQLMMSVFPTLRSLLDVPGRALTAPSHRGAIGRATNPTLDLRLMASISPRRTNPLTALGIRTATVSPSLHGGRPRGLPLRITIRFADTAQLIERGTPCGSLVLVIPPRLPAARLRNKSVHRACSEYTSQEQEANDVDHLLPPRTSVNKTTAPRNSLAHPLVKIPRKPRRTFSRATSKSTQHRSEDTHNCEEQQTRHRRSRRLPVHTPERVRTRKSPAGLTQRRDRA